MHASNEIVNFQETEELIREYNRLYDENIKTEQLFLNSQVSLKDSYDSNNPIIRNTNSVILACKHNNVQILEYILGSDKSITIQYNDEDEAHHNAFYYGIRSNNTELLGTLINNWPDNYFSDHEEELDTILSTAYEELKLKNVPLSEQMEIFVENKLINIRFFSNTSGSVQKYTGNHDSTIKRIELVLQNISSLKKDYSNQEKVDEKFLYVAKFIAQNIHILKRQLRSTYARLPWEEIEFCLVSFVSSQTKRQEINLFYCASLNKHKILKYLEHFAKKLKDEKDNIKNLNIDQLTKLPKLRRRADVLAGIIRSYPQFQELYDDYQRIRDIRSLEKISDYIKLALSANTKEKHEQLIITRALQVIGEHLKNTLESPKLTNNTSDLILLSLPKYTRKMLLSLRDTLSHANSFDRRIQIEENSNENFFIKIQNDIKKVGDLITIILHNNKIKTVRKLLTKIVHSKNIDEIEDVTDGLNSIELDVIISENFKMLEHEKLKKLVNELSDIITDKTIEEKGLFNEINNILNGAETQSKTIRTDFITGVKSLLSCGTHYNFSNFSKIHHFNMNLIKEHAKTTLKKIDAKIEPISIKEISGLSTKLYRDLSLRIQSHNQNKVLQIIFEILLISEFRICNIKGIEELTEILNEKEDENENQQRTNNNIRKDKYNKYLAIKLSALKSILPNNTQSSRLFENVALYENDKKLQAGVEMLVLDIMSILDSPKHYQENNPLFLDDNTPLLVGKCLRNYLAHDNTVVDVVLFSASSRAVILNAKKITKENLTMSKKNIGKLITDDSLKLNVKYERGLHTIINTEKMFAALEKGNLESLKYCFRNGTDVYARSTINSWTTLHFAAKGPSLEFVKFILAQNININVIDIDFFTPLHIAAAHGKTNNVEFLVKQSGVHIDVLNNDGRTPLHLAVQNGHKDTVEVLLKNIANTVIQDKFGFPPLHYAIMFNRMDIVRILLAREINVDINESFGGFTALHSSAASGHLELVQFLLQNKANVNATPDKNLTPLHGASLHGHIEIANALIYQGANINARAINGCTPLRFAVSNGHEKVVNILLKHRAKVNAVDKPFNVTPLHDAALTGREGIVKALLQNNAMANVTTLKGITPLHYAAHSSNLETVVALLKHGVDVNAKDENNSTSLHNTAISGHKEIAKLLIENNADINAKNNDKLTPLHVAAQYGSKDFTELLISYKADINAKETNGRTPLYVATEHGCKDIIDLLINHGAEVNSTRNDGRTPLHEAALSGHTDFVDFLIRHEAEVNATDNNGFTPLHIAASVGHKDVVNLLIKNKVDVNVSCIANLTALQLTILTGNEVIVDILVANGADINVKFKTCSTLDFAIYSKNKEIVKILIKNGANVNGKDTLKLAVVAGCKYIINVLLLNKACVNVRAEDNTTLLHGAAICGHKQIVDTLIKSGADINAIDIFNRTPLHLAAIEGHEEVIEILISSGAKVDVKTHKYVTPLYLH